MVTTIVPPIENPAIFHSFLLIIFNSKKASTTQNFKKVFIKFSCEIFPSTIFPPFKKHHPFLFWRENSTHHFWGPSVSQALHYAAYHGHLSCVTELMKSNPRKVPAFFQKPNGGGLRVEDFSYRDVFFFFEASSEVSKFWCFGTLVVVFDLLFLIDIYWMIDIC